jgi:hypothetical protein
MPLNLPNIIDTEGIGTSLLWNIITNPDKALHPTAMKRGGMAAGELGRYRRHAPRACSHWLVERNPLPGRWPAFRVANKLSAGLPP